MNKVSRVLSTLPPELALSALSVAPKSKRSLINRPVEIFSPNSLVVVFSSEPLTSVELELMLPDNPVSQRPLRKGVLRVSLPLLIGLALA